MLIIASIFLSALQYVSPDGETSTPTSTPTVAASLFSMPTLPLDPYAQNLTVLDITPRSIGLRWSCKYNHLHDKYEITLKPLKATYRVIETIPRNTCYQTIENLLPDTDYQIFLTLFSRNIRRRSNILIVKTPMEEPETEFDEILQEEPSRELKMPQVKAVELSLVGLALILWIIAIALFFHRWGKIRMLLPYQPDFKEKEECTNCVITPLHQCSRLPLQLHADYHGLNAGIGLVSLADTGCSPLRPRLNSFVTSNTVTDTKIPAELRIYRKAKSAECLSPKHEEIEFVNF